MERMDLEETAVEAVKRNGGSWMGHVSKREDIEHVKRYCEEGKQYVWSK